MADPHNVSPASRWINPSCLHPHRWINPCLGTQGPLVITVMSTDVTIHVVLLISMTVTTVPRPAGRRTQEPDPGRREGSLTNVILLHPLNSPNR